jgi:hypothetical protein
MGPIHAQRTSDIRHRLSIVVTPCDLETVTVLTALPDRPYDVADQAGTLTPTHEGARRVAAKWSQSPRVSHRLVRSGPLVPRETL